jgi:hypothetical protein
MIDLSNESSDVITDWIETLAVVQAGRPLSFQRVQEISENFASISTNRIPYSFSQLKKRGEILGEKYPFLIDDSYIATKKNIEDSTYLQMLFLTPKSGLSTQSKVYNLDIASKLFEEIAEKCLSNFFGANTQTVNFGFPSKSDRPADFAAAVKWLSEKTNIRLGNAYRPPRKKDGGVDLFVWKSFSDKRPGIPIMLVQCTIKEDFINKIGDIDLKLWSSWLSSDIEPLVALAIPGVATKEEIWSEITTRGILLDRLRLIESIDDNSNLTKIDNIDYLKRQVKELADLVH